MHIVSRYFIRENQFHWIVFQVIYIKVLFIQKFNQYLIFHWHLRIFITNFQLVMKFIENNATVYIVYALIIYGKQL